jgi:hypothetical protein
MAGSLVYRQYTSDSGQPYAMRCDESNARAAVTSNSNALSRNLTANVPQLPRGVTKRYVLCYNRAVPAMKRKFWVGDVLNIPQLLLPGATITGEDYPGAADTAGVNQTWVVTAYRGEKVTVVPAFDAPDTGLTDGTTTQ